MFVFLVVVLYFLTLDLNFLYFVDLNFFVVLNFLTNKIGYPALRATAEGNEISLKPPRGTPLG